jgi:hypothetical protein
MPKVEATLFLRESLDLEVVLALAMTLLLIAWLNDITRTIFLSG